jgi:superoxide reductase
MERRAFIISAISSGTVMVLGRVRALAKEYYLDTVDPGLWQGINRVKNPKDKTTLEKLHSPVIKAPQQIKAGEAFPIEISIGEMPHPMGPEHWIEHLQLNIGNNPAGTVQFRSKGFVRAAARFDVMLGSELRGKTISLIVQIKCNLHGIWQNYANIRII